MFSLQEYIPCGIQAILLEASGHSTVTDIISGEWKHGRGQRISILDIEESLLLRQSV